MKIWLERVPREMLRGPRVACFDTRIRQPLFIGRHGAPLMAAYLRKRGIMPFVPPQGFWVKERAGRLEAGETARATAWIASLGEMVARPARPTPELEPQPDEGAPAE